VDGVARREQLAVLAEDPVLEASRGPARLGERDLDREQVVVARGRPVRDVRLGDGQEQPVLGLEVAVAQPLRAEELVARRLEEPEVVRVVDDLGGIAVAVDHADLHPHHVRPPRSG
jgi:hypothetical protein